MVVFWVVVQCSVLAVCQCFGGTYCSQNTTHHKHPEDHHLYSHLFADLKSCRPKSKLLCISPCRKNMKVFENIVLRRIFGCRREVATGG
jgi:hypothetical protein